MLIYLISWAGSDKEPSARYPAHMKADVQAENQKYCQGDQNLHGVNPSQMKASEILNLLQ